MAWAVMDLVFAGSRGLGLTLPDRHAIAALVAAAATSQTARQIANLLVPGSLRRRSLSGRSGTRPGSVSAFATAALVAIQQSPITPLHRPSGDHGLRTQPIEDQAIEPPAGAYALAAIRHRSDA